MRRPDQDTGGESVTVGAIDGELLVDKRTLAARWLVTPRTIEKYQALGMPYLPGGKNLYELNACTQWRRDYFGRLRAGKEDR